MIYDLRFKKEALNEWEKLDGSLKKQFKKKLAQILDQPHIPKNRLYGSANRYKIKLRQSGYRLVYTVYDDEVVVEVIAIGRRDKSSVYKAAAKR